MLGANSYGKQGIRLVRVVRGAHRHELHDLTVDVRLEGDFEPAYVAGDNAAVLPTDTMRSTVYALAKDHPPEELEDFGELLARRFLEASPAARRAGVRLARHLWARVEAAGVPHPHAFTRGDGGESWTAEVTASRGEDRVEVVSGLDGLLLLKTAGSAFEGFLRDRFTVLEEASDRILATALLARWSYGEPAAWSSCRTRVRRALVETFAGHDSRSLQHTLHAMGAAALDACPEVARVTLVLPNRHHVLADLAPFGLGNDNEVYVATDRPFGLIEGTVEREGRPPRDG
jgi:urate oxidase